FPHSYSLSLHDALPIFVATSSVVKVRQAAVVFILVTVTLDMLTVGLIGPVLPKLILNFMGGNMKNAADWNGWFGLVFALMQFFRSEEHTSELQSLAYLV